MKKAILLKTCMALAATAVLALGTGHAAAEPWEDGSHGPDGMGRGMRGKQGEYRHQWMEKLNLSADQKKKIDQIRGDQRESMKATAEQLRAEHEKMHTLMQGDATDAQLREQHLKVRALHTAMGDARFESLLKIRAILTAGQRKRMGMMHHEGMEPGGMRHGDPDMKGPGMK